METRVRVMGLEIDVLTEEHFSALVEEYLTNDYLNIVHFVSMDYVEEEPSEAVRLTMADADLVLPGEKAVLSAHHADILEAGGMMVEYSKAFKVMRDVGLRDKKVYYVMRNKREAKSFYGLVHSQGLSDTCVGIYVEDGKMTEEALINDINTQVPDIIVLALDKEKQERWIFDNKPKINSKLCVCIGGILPLVSRENPLIPKWIKTLHLTKLYRKVLKIPNSHLLRKRIFNKKMADYNNRKQKED